MVDEVGHGVPCPYEDIVRCPSHRLLPAIGFVSFKFRRWIRPYQLGCKDPALKEQAASRRYDGLSGYLTMQPYPKKSIDFRSVVLLLCRISQIAIGLGFGTFSLFFIGPEMKRANTSVSLLQQIAGVMVVAGAYLDVAVVATKDIRWSSVLAICLALLSTPVFAFLWLSSGWSMPSAQAARPLLYYIGGNVVLFLAALFAVITLVAAKEWRNAR